MSNTAADAILDQDTTKEAESKSAETKASEKKTDSKTTSAKSAEKKPEVKKTEEKKVEAKKVEDKKAPDKEAATEPADESCQEAEEKIEKVINEAPEAVQPAQTEVQKSDEIIYPYDVILKRPVSTFRGPNAELLCKPFGGKITVLGIVGNFYKVQFVRAGFGSVTAYVLCQEVERCTW